MKSKKHFEVYGYYLTGNPDEADHSFHYSDSVVDKLTEAYDLALSARSRALPKLLKLVDKYDKVPVFKNYLSVYYMQCKEEQKAFAVNQRIVREHPEYLHGRLNLAAQYILRDELEKALEILGAELDLKAMYPDREVFHFNEFESFTSVACDYLSAVGRMEEATMRLETLEEVYPDSPKIPHIRGRLQMAKYVRWRQHIVGKGYDEECQTDQPPQLKHTELQVLYEKGLRIPDAELRALLALPRESLIDDLKAILRDSVCRYEYFAYDQSKEWEEETHTFPLHALFMLTELRAYDQLPFMLDILGQGEEYLEFWYGDHLFETIWPLIYLLGRDQLATLQAFVLEPDIHHDGKTVVAQAVSQIPFHQPDRKEEVLNWFKGIFTYFLDHLGEESLIDPDAVTHLTSNLMDLPDGAKLMSFAERFYEEGLIDTTIIGDLDEFRKEVRRVESDNHGLPLFDSMFEHYEHIRTKWYGYMTEEEQIAADAAFEKKVEEFKREELRLAQRNTQMPGPSQAKPDPKVGRNDPCPCGSGKKYKKCCWNK